MKAKLELFGRDLLCKNIRQKDLTPDAQKALMEGSLQAMPVRDCTGRLVTILLQDLADPATVLKTKMQRDFYVSLVHSEDESIQRNGSVIILWRTSRKFQRAAAWKYPRFLEALPVRRNAIHVCFDPYAVSPVAALAKYACEKIIRQRIRIHTGK